MSLIFVCSMASLGLSQTTEFTYQRKLTDSGTPQATYQMEFKLFGSLSGADQIGGAITNPNVPVNQGVFTVNLDFGASAFPGADRYLQISVRRSAGESFVTLNPRQQITSSPYSIRTLSAAQADVALDANKLGGVDANQYVTTSSVGNAFIKNSTTQQTGANFNIDGNGIVGNSLGVGTLVPESGYRLDVSGAGVFRTGNGRINFGSPSGETGMAIISNSPNNRADVRFDGFTLKLNAGLNSTAPCCGIAINTAGNVGIGTTTPSLLNGGTGRLVSISDSFNPGLALTNTGSGGRQFFLYSAGGSGSFRYSMPRAILTDLLLITAATSASGHRHPRIASA